MDGNNEQERTLSVPGTATAEPKKKRTSKVHQFFEDVGSSFKCLICGVMLTKGSSGSTSNLLKHLKGQHIEEYKTIETITAKGKRKQPGGPLPLERKGFLNKLSKLIVSCDLPYSIVDKPEFVDFVGYISKDQEVTRLPGRTSITSEVASSFVSTKAKVIGLIQQAKSRVNLVVDVWTSSNCIAFLGVICRVIDKDFQLMTFPLDLTQLSGAHSGENLAHALMPVITEYNLEDKIVSITTDNAANMTTFFKHLAEGLKEKGIIFDVKNQRVRCLAHILNLCAKALISSTDKKVPVKKLHLALSEIGRTPQRKEIYYRQCGERKLLPGLDTDHRWNSTFDMIDLSLEMRSAIDQICTKEVDSSLVKCRITEEEWSQLGKLRDILSPIKKATLKMSEQKSPCIAEATNVYQELFEHFDKYLNDSDSQDDWIEPSVSKAKEKLLDYYCESGGMAYSNGMILHPSYKTVWFSKKNWKQSWITEYKKLITNEWTSRYKNNSALSEESVDEMNSEEMRHRELMGSGTWFDELAKYLKDPVVPLHQLNKIGLLAWWKGKEQEYPRLSEMARDYLSVAGSSVPVESFFSSGTDVLTDNRQKLTGEHIKQLMCLKMWQRHGLAD